MKIEIPGLCLIALVGASSSGKSTFAADHFLPTEVLSSDYYRGVVCDDENDQSVSAEAFDLLYYAAEKRLSLGKRTVIDATNLQSADRKKIVALGKAHDVHTAAIVLNTGEKELIRRGEAREDRHISPKTLKAQRDAVVRSLGSLKKEGFRFVFSLSEEDQAEICYTRLWSDKKDLHGPFDIIGDVHGCSSELEELLKKLGYGRDEDSVYRHPEGRTAVFLGDLVDRGPGNLDVLRLVMKMVEAGEALCLPGNHENKLGRYLNRRNVQISHGLEKTIEELSGEDQSELKKIREFLDSLVSHYLLDEGRLVVSHAGIKQEYIGRASARIREFCLYGDTTGETDDLGRPVRLDWAEQYRGKPLIVYGHVPRQEVYELNNTFCIDTGCVFGGKLTCFRYPEKELVSVTAKKQYYAPVSPLGGEGVAKDGLMASDVLGKMYVETELIPGITIREEQTGAALEVMSRYAADPHWLIYLPPTMSPCETSDLPDYLEYPLEAFRYYEHHGVRQVVCEKKHMGSRAVIVLCRDEESAARRFKAPAGESGIVYTRMGRRFFSDRGMEKELLKRLGRVLAERDFWEDFHTDWLCLDCELMPWSEKALSLIKSQYGPIGRAGRESLNAEREAIGKAIKALGKRSTEQSEADANTLNLEKLAFAYDRKSTAMEGYVRAYREYCWDVRTIDDMSVAPFHLLAVEGRVFTDMDHLWHMEQLKKYCTGADGLFVATEHMTVDVSDPESTEAGVQWWRALTGAGGEGMVVKPLHYIARSGDKLLQPAVKCRGREYLRIIYGPEYLFDEHLKRLKKRSLSQKRSLALKEFALGIEALKRFAAGEPLNRVHQCVFGVLALESEPVDPRL